MTYRGKTVILNEVKDLKSWLPNRFPTFRSLDLSLPSH